MLILNILIEWFYLTREIGSKILHKIMLLFVAIPKI